MADKPFNIEEQFLDLLKLIHQQQVLLYTLHEYLTEQPFYDGKRFAELFEEFQADLIAALKRRPKSSTDAFLKLLKDFEGPAH
jgi:hypothetical protein